MSFYFYYEYYFNSLYFYRKKSFISKFELSVIAICVSISVVGGIASTYSSIDKLFSPATFVPPCYLNRTQ